MHNTVASGAGMRGRQRAMVSCARQLLRPETVLAGFVEEPWHWLYESATDYFSNKKGLPDIVIF